MRPKSSQCASVDIPQRTERAECVECRARMLFHTGHNRPPASFPKRYVKRLIMHNIRVEVSVFNILVFLLPTSFKPIAGAHDSH
jgi:hypothetical protein